MAHLRKRPVPSSFLAWVTQALLLQGMIGETLSDCIRSSDGISRCDLTRQDVAPGRRGQGGERRVALQALAGLKVRCKKPKEFCVHLHRDLHDAQRLQKGVYAQQADMLQDAGIEAFPFDIDGDYEPLKGSALEALCRRSKPLESTKTGCISAVSMHQLDI